MQILHFFSLSTGSRLVQSFNGFVAGLTLLAALLGVAATAQASSSLGATSVGELPAAGSDSVVLAAPGTAWTATANASWLHLSTTNQSGTGSTNVIFTFDANPSLTARFGTITIVVASLTNTLTVAQGGSSYQSLPFITSPVGKLTTLVSNGLSFPKALTLDGSGNVYIADTGNAAIKEWNVASGSVTTLVSNGLAAPTGLAVDGAGNVYIADEQENDEAILKWNAASQTMTMVATNGELLYLPQSVAVDGAGNLFIVDSDGLEELNVASNTLTTLLGGAFTGVALDPAGNIYLNTGKAIVEWNAASRVMTTLVPNNSLPSGYNPAGVAVDGSGNVYTSIGSSSGGGIVEWKAANNTVMTPLSLTAQLNSPSGVAVDVAGNIYILDTGHSALKELPRPYVPTLTAQTVNVPYTAGTNVLPVVLPSTENLTGFFTPTSSQPWLTVLGATNGVVSVAFSGNTNTTTSRSGTVTLLGAFLFVNQAQAGVPALGVTNLVEGPGAGRDSVALEAFQGGWTVATNAPWLHLDAANSSGFGSTNVAFTFDFNPGQTRVGTLTVTTLSNDTATLNITQAGSAYVAAGPFTTLVSSGLHDPAGVAVDGAGNVYIADTFNNAIKEWNAASDTVTTLVSSGLNYPYGVAVDASGNVYIADTDNNAIKKWSAASNTVTTLVSSGLNYPYGVAVDASGNIYIADTDNNAIKECNSAGNSLTPLLTNGLNTPTGVSVDVAGNLYIANTFNNSIVERYAATATVTTLVSNGLASSYGVAVDGAGNVFIADIFNNAIKEWNAISNTVTTPFSANSYFPFGIAVDGSRNLYTADYGNGAIEELPRAFVNPTSRTEPSTAGSDALPVVLPATQNLTGPFAPTSDQSWLTIPGITNGVVNYAFTANNGAGSRTAHIAVLGQSIAITQAALVSRPILIGATLSTNGVFRFSFTNSNPSATFTVLSTTNLSTPLTKWTMIGAASNIAPGLLQFTDTQPTNSPRFYTVRSP